MIEYILIADIDRETYYPVCAGGSVNECRNRAKKWLVQNREMLPQSDYDDPALILYRLTDNGRYEIEEVWKLTPQVEVRKLFSWSLTAPPCGAD